MNEAEMQLVQRLARGDPAAFAELYDACGGQLFRVAWGLIGARSEAEDAVQDVFVALVQAGPKLARVENLKAYLFTALRHAAGRRLMQVKKLPLVPLEQAAHLAGRTDESPELEQLLSTLSAEQREVLVLKLKGELTFAEIGTVLGISANTAASRYRYALEKLKATWQQEEESHARP